VQHTGADGITLANDVTDSQLTGNFTNDIAGSALTVGHPQHVYIGNADPDPNDPHEKYPASVEGVCKNITVTDNYLYDSAVLFQGSSPVSAYFADTLDLEHNRIEKSPWAGITLGWGWDNFDGTSNSNVIYPGSPTTTAKNNTVKYNELIDTMQVLGDSAPIYTLGKQPGTEISNNFIQGEPAGHRYGIHPDEGSAYINEHAKPDNSEGRRALAVAADDEDVKATVTAFLEKAGFDVVDVGSLAESWRIEPMGVMPAIAALAAVVESRRPPRPVSRIASSTSASRNASTPVSTNSPPLRYSARPVRPSISVTLMPDVCSGSMRE
jgi:hypothetical protein